MKLPNNFRQFFPTEAVKQVSQFISNPKLTEALRDAAEKAGFKDAFSNSNLQPINKFSKTLRVGWRTFRNSLQMNSRLTC